MLKDLVRKNRSYRRFQENVPIDNDTLKELVELARLSASGANRQPLKYLLSCEPQTNVLIFPHLAWAGYLQDWPGPDEGERPAAYIVILADTDISANAGCDHGIAAQSILLGAVEKGLGGCMIGSIRKQDLRDALNIPDRYDILLVIALGVPQETVVLDTISPEGDIKYWRDANGVHHVPKRALSDLLLDISPSR
jgi:nitroreductase